MAGAEIGRGYVEGAITLDGDPSQSNNILISPQFSLWDPFLQTMAPFWEKPMNRILKHKNKQDTQAGKPSILVVRSSDSTGNTSKSDTSADYGAHDQVAPATVHSTSSSKQPLTTISSAPTPQATLPAATVGSPQPSPAGSAPCMPSSLRGPLWNQAYDGLKEKEPELVDAYERILSRELSGGEWSSIDLESQKNEIEQGSPEKRRSQMMRFIQAGLDKTEKEAVVKQGIEDGMQAVHSVKGIIDKAVKVAPEAALAWVGVCFALEVGFFPRDYDCLEPPNLLVDSRKPNQRSRC